MWAITDSDFGHSGNHYVPDYGVHVHQDWIKVWNFSNFQKLEILKSFLHK